MRLCAALNRGGQLPEPERLGEIGVDGSDARWINHACEPNCEAREEKKRVHIYALRDIKRGEELNYDYGLVVDDKQMMRDSDSRLTKQAGR